MDRGTRRRAASSPTGPGPAGGANACLRAACVASALTAAVFIAVPAAADSDDFSIEEAASASIESLMDVRVTSVAGTEQDWFGSPAALYVMTGEDLRRSGHHTLADLLRTMPGVFVGSSGAHNWVVGMRGFSGGLANKTLVMIDGRTVYDPLFGGTFWDIQDILLQDLERIEVIRGPGATLWGANAVNGVINVTTKKARDTQGAYLKSGGGSEEHGFVSARYGGLIGDAAAFRVWGKYFERDNYSRSGGGSAHDAWDLAHGGFRFDVDAGPDTDFTLQGDIYNLGELGEEISVPVPNAHRQFTTQINTGWTNGGNVLLRGTHRHSETAGWNVQVYYDRTSRTLGGGFHVERDTADLDVRNHFRLGDRQEIHWGLGYRHSADNSRASELLSLTPDSRSLNTWSGFVQDTIALLPDRVFAMIGTKLEHNSFTGFEVQPAGRLWWTPDDRNTLWASISRPVRVPTRIEQDGFLTVGIVDTGEAGGGAPSGVFVPIGIAGNSGAESEELIAYELGYRRKITDDLTIDIAPFYNDYTRLLFVQNTFQTWSNAGSGESYGVEVTSLWRPLDIWALAGSYSYVDVQIHGDLFPSAEGDAPHHQVKLLSFLDLFEDFELNTGLYFVDRLPTAHAPPYLRFDQGITWHATPWLDLAIWGQNLLEDTHREASSSVQVERAFYVEVNMNFGARR